MNVMLTKLGYAKATNFCIFDGEKESTRRDESMLHIIKKTPTPSKLEREINEMIKLPNKIQKTKPSGTVRCKVTNALSPNEIWVQDVVDADSCYEKYKFRN
jgi:hypothetical protein